MTAYNEWSHLEEVWVGRPYPPELIGTRYDQQSFDKFLSHM
jgi:hypothetical protein